MGKYINTSLFDFQAWLICLAAIALFAVSGWLYSLWRRNVNIVDSMWSLMFLLALLVYLANGEIMGWRAGLILALVCTWSLRLAGYLHWRNHGQEEDRRYQAIRRNNEPGFSFKSLYLIFGLQGVLAWLICLPLLAAVAGQSPPGLLDFAGVSVWILGFFFQVIGDVQLARFKAGPENANSVLNTGLWRYTRHPNYFGESAMWWGYFLLALSAGGGWTIISPLLMTFLLLRVSGVSMLEKDISERRPAYREYILQTNTFLPGQPRIPADRIAVESKGSRGL